MKITFIILLLIASIDMMAQTTFATLNGSKSTNAVTYQWKQISGIKAVLISPNTALCRADSLTVGVRLFELTCINPFGTSKDSVMITVVAPTYRVSIINAKYNVTSLSWSTVGEVGVSYFLIERSYNGGSFYFITKTTAQGFGNANYKIFLAVTPRPYTYRLRAVFKNGVQDTNNVIFK